MNTELFGTDGIRGPAGEYPLDKKGAALIGQAVATYFCKNNRRVVVGCDPRESSSWLVEAVIDGLVSAGAQVDNIGVVPTPGLAYLTKQRGAAAGVMITASHNPYTDNGIKIFTSEGRKLTDEMQADLNKLANGTTEDQPGGSSVEASDAIHDYQTFVVVAANGVSLDGWRIGVDSANGAASGIASHAFEVLGAEVVSLFDKPDGQNINAGCGATDPGKLQETVKAQQLDAGVAFDGDADRVVLVDSQGRQLTGDHLLYILAVTSQYKTVVATQMSNTGLDAALQKHGVTVQRTGVGDRQVLQAMEAGNFLLGGEQSGHIILKQHTETGDGLLAAIVALSQARTSGKSLAEWYDDMPLVPQRLVNIPLDDKSLLQRPEITDYISAATKELSGQGQLNIRASGTEPKLRIMVEAPDADARAQTIADDLTRLLSAAGK